MVTKCFCLLKGKQVLLANWKVTKCFWLLKAIFSIEKISIVEKYLHLTNLLQEVKKKSRRIQEEFRTSTKKEKVFKKGKFFFLLSKCVFSC